MEREIEEINNRLKFRILSCELTFTIKSILKLEHHNELLKTNLYRVLPAHVVNEFLHRQHIAYNIKFHSIKSTNMRKLRELTSVDLEKN